MADSSSNLLSQSGSDTGSKQKKGRGPTQLKELTLSRIGDQRTPIEFDAVGNPIGPNKKKFNSYVALQGRSKVSILKKDWDDVEPCVKDNIWESIMLTFDIPKDNSLKRKCFSYAGERWKAFKTDLTTKYVFGPKEDPCQKYPFLDDVTWERFLESRKDPAFIEARKKAQETAAKNCHPHRLSRGGYALLEEKIMQQNLKERNEASQAYPSLVVSPPSPPTRHEKWKRARQKSSGEYTSEPTRIVAEKIDSLVEQSSQGTFMPIGREDILTVAIGRPEHSGRVRTAGRGVGIRQYFGLPSFRHGCKGGNVSREELEVVREKMRQEITEEVEERLRKDIEERLAKEVEQRLAKEVGQRIRQELESLGLSQGKTKSPPSHSPIYVSTKGSCAPNDEDVLEKDFLDIPDMCKLYVEDPFHLVAFGKVYNLGPIIHHIQIGDDKVRVVVEQVEDAKALVPVPTEEVQTVGQAPKHFILWPKRLVKPIQHEELDIGAIKDVPTQQKELDVCAIKDVVQTVATMDVKSGFDLVQQKEPEVDPMARLCILALKIGKHPLQLNLEANVIGKSSPIPLSIFKRDILELTMNDMLCVSVLQVWLMYLHHLCKLKGNTDTYGFIDPVHIQNIGNHSDDIQNYIHSRINEGNECYLAPYYYSAHWQLIIICPKQNVVVFLCSKWNKANKDIKAIVNGAMRSWHTMKGKHLGVFRMPTWKEPRCPKQTGNTECGYYVMRHMLNIVSVVIVDSWDQRFTNKQPFSEDEIDDVRRL